MELNQLVMSNDNYVERINAAIDKGHFPKIEAENAYQYTPTNEFAHTLCTSGDKLPFENRNFAGMDLGKIKKVRKEVEEVHERYISEIARLKEEKDRLYKSFFDGTITDEQLTRLKEVEKLEKTVRISGYAEKSVDEFFAEAFTDAKIGNNPSKYSDEVLNIIDKYFAKNVEIKSKSSKIKLAINLFDKDDPLYLEAFSIEPIKGFEDVFLHGSPSSVQKTIDGEIKLLSPKEFASFLKENGYSGKDIRLGSCSTGYGDNSFAQQLSKELGCKVLAPDDDVYFDKNEGVMFVGSSYNNIGKWRLFNNGVEE